MEQEYLDKVHRFSLEMLEYIDKICEKYDIKYSLDCGTLIGAVRDKGFIPWDDDADIAFTRDEYVRFLDALSKEKLPDNYKLYIPKNIDHFFDFIVRMYNVKEPIRNDKDSVEHFNGFYQYPIVDFFVYDNIPDNDFLKFIYILKQQILFGLAMSRRYTIEYNRYGFFTRIFIFVLSKIGKFFSLKSICKMQEKACSRYKNTKKLYCTSWSPEYPGYQYDASDFIDYKNTSFENTNLKIFSNYDNILKVYYGDDYMIPKKTHDHIGYISKF